MTDSIKKEWEDLFNESSYDDRVSSLADVLALQFLGLVDRKMEMERISKKQLAEKIGTSAAFITQLFRGDRKPNWNTLAKMSLELDLDFKIMSEELFQEKVQEELIAYHKRWSKTQEYLKLKEQVTNPQLVMAVSQAGEDEYAMAG
jgi:transcriptional regulator with XRE-family HTH domain